jgi:hypothetical protein
VGELDGAEEPGADLPVVIALLDVFATVVEASIAEKET